MASKTTEEELDRMVKNLTRELAALNVSTGGFFNQFSAVSLRPLTLQTASGSNGSNSSGGSSSGGAGEWEGPGEGSEQGEGEEVGVEVSEGVVWTLVAPLILLGLLVVIGVSVACLWRLRDRR